MRNFFYMACWGVLVAGLAAWGPVLAQDGSSDATNDDPIDLDLGLDEGLDIVDSKDRHEARLERFHTVPNDAFGVGETLVYSVRYGFIRAGEARLEVGPIRQVNGRPVFHLLGSAKSSDFFSSFFKVDDRIDSYMDTEYLMPWRFEKQLNEGNYHSVQRVEMDQVNRVARYDDGRSFEMSPSAQDMLSVLYRLRTVELKPGWTGVLKTHADHKNVDLEVRVRGRKKISTPAGKFDCLEVEPYILLDTGLYDHKKGKLVMYLTDDERKLPVLYRIKVFFGSIEMTLTELHTAEG